MRFLCDHMLAKLGRWLRAAGYDAELARGTAEDKEILARAVQEKRLLLTRDRHFLEMEEAKGHVIYLHANALDEIVGALNAQLHLNWLYKPFSRCLLCNALLRKSTRFWYCDHCKKTYWMGSHTEHMLEQLRRWNGLVA